MLHFFPQMIYFTSFNNIVEQLANVKFMLKSGKILSIPAKTKFRKNYT